MKPRTMYSRVSIEADLAVAPLPRELKTMWRADAAPDLPVKMHRREFVDRVRREAGLPSRRRAEILVDAVFGAPKEHLSPGEADDIQAQLPADLKGVWARA